MSIDKINGYTQLPVSNASEGSAPAKVRPDEARPQAERERTDQADTVSVTDAASRLQRLEQSVAGLPEVDSSRVEAVRRAVADGSYHVDPARVADKLLGFENALTGKVK
jgi:negative regulator of flagellin synthesis FlgM